MYINKNSVPDKQYTCIFISLNVCTQVYMYAKKCVHLCKQVYMYVNKWTCMYTSVHVCKQVYIYVNKCTCM